MDGLGTHLLLDMAGCNPQILDDTEEVRRALVRAATQAKATVLGHSFHKFAPQGVSGVVVIAESHISIHTWPEYAYAAIDVFTCGDRAMPHRAVEVLLEAFAPTRHKLQEIARGSPQPKPNELPAEQLQWRPAVERGWA